MSLLTGYIGTYSSPESTGIYRFTMNPETGALSGPELFYEAPDCKYLSCYKNILAVPVTRGKKAGLLALTLSHPSSALLGELCEEKTPPCYVTQDDTHIYTANYHEGTVMIYRKDNKALTLEQKISIAPKAGCHQVIFYRNYMMVPCLLLDQIKIYDRNRNYEEAGELNFPPGTGPRHGIFDRKQSRFFLVSELSNELFLYRISQDGMMTLAEKHSILSKESQASAPPASAAIRLSPDERFLYISTRFADVITVFRLDGLHAEMVAQTGSGGTHPRDIILTPDGRFLLAANRTEGGLVSFRIDQEHGILEAPCSRISAPEAVSIVLEQS